jgi:hypothetical protein
VKTISLKKVAVITVAALGLTLNTSVPSQAADVTTGQVTSITLARVTAEPTVGSAVAVNMGAAITAVGSTATFVGTLTAYPAGGYVATAAAITLGNGSAASTAIGTGSAGTTTGNTLVLATTSASSVVASATTPAGAGSFSFTPTKAGTYTLTVWHDPAGAGAIDLTETRQTIDIVVAAASTYSAPLSTMYLGTGSVAATSTTNLLPVSIAKTAGAGAAQANIRINLKNGLGADYAGQTITATIAGPGLIAGSATAAANTAVTTAGTVRSATFASSTGFAVVTVTADGTSGVGAVTVSVTDQFTGVTSVLGTKSITFYGSVAKLTATANYVVLKAAGGVTGGSTGSVTTAYADLANRINATDIPAVVIKATDSSGTPAGGLTIKIRSGDVTKGNSTTVAGTDDANGCVEDVLSVANVYSSGGTGFYNCALSTPTSAKSGDATTMTFYVLDPADALGVAELTTVVNVTVGGTTPGTETITFDKASYAPGEAMNVTRTCKDTSGNTCADGTAAPAVTFSKSVGGTAPAASTYVAGKRSSTSSTGVASVFAPAVGGAFTANATSGNAAGSAITASASVTDGNAGLLTQIDALNAKIVALNALIAKIMKKLGVK